VNAPHIPKIKEIIKNSSTVLIVNQDYATENFQEGFKRPKEFYEAIKAADFIFCQEPWAQKFMNFMLKVHMRSEKKAWLVPHPCDTKGLKSLKIDYDERIDLLAVMYHRYRNELLLPSMVSWGLKYPSVLFGYVGGHIPVGLFNFTAPMMSWSKYFYVLAHCTLALDYVSMYHCMGRFPQECLLPDELVVTKRGLIPIKDVKVGDYVLTHKGRFRRVLEKFEREYNGELIQIRTYGYYKPITLTPDHPILVSVVVFQKRHFSRKGKEWYEYRRVINTPRWVHAKDIRKNNIPKTKYVRPRIFLLYPINREVSDREILDLSYTITYRDKRKPRKVVVKVPLNKEFCKLIGYYLSEGSTYLSKKRGRYIVEFSFGHSRKETELAKDALNCSRRLGFGASITYLKTATKVVVYSRALADFFRREFGHGARNKRVPTWVLKLPSSKLKHILEAYLAGDGCVTRNVATTTSLNLAYGMKEIGNVLGYRVTVQKRPKHESQIGGRKVVGKESYVVQFNKGKENRTINTGEFILLRLRSVKKIPYKGKVFNLHVEEDNSYCTFYHTVHNCACLGIPTVCTDRIYMGHKLFPMTTLDPMDFEGIRTTLQKLIDNEEFYHQVADYAFEKVEDYNWENSKKRLLTAMEEVGLKVG
jgi:intein/homing endonuclease